MGRPPDPPGARGVPESIGEVASEFASVALRINHDGNGPRLEIEDLRTGHVGYLDALELETLAWLPEGALHGLLDPSHTRWRSEDPGGR
ncbi:MAG: hypothetical protein ACRD0O_09190 [Acidimicrobiia bacterium]